MQILWYVGHSNYGKAASINIFSAVVRATAMLDANDIIPCSWQTIIMYNELCDGSSGVPFIREERRVWIEVRWHSNRSGWINERNERRPWDAIRVSCHLLDLAIILSFRDLLLPIHNIRGIYPLLAVRGDDYTWCLDKLTSALPRAKCQWLLRYAPMESLEMCFGVAASVWCPNLWVFW